MRLAARGTIKIFEIAARRHKNKRLFSFDNIVSHRFDNMPTLNSSFMGVASDGRHLTRLTMP
jgi:hypothetical protein